MKVYNIIKNALLILSVVFLALSGIVGAALLTSEGAAIATIVIGQVVLSFVGVFLLYTKNDVARKLGYAFLTTSFVICLVHFVAIIEITAPAVLMLVGIILYALYYVVCGIGYLARKGKGSLDDPDDDPRIIKLRKWKKIHDEGLITAEEFEEKRQEVLGIKKTSK